MSIERRVIALGFFDGVHRGHGELLKVCARRAAELSASSAVMTFDRHPDDLVSGGRVSLINSREDRVELICGLYGIDEVLFTHFDESMMKMPWDSFVSDYLVGHLSAVSLVAGHDFRFGYKGEGNPALLTEKCRQLGIGCDIVPKFELGGVTVSSSHIRELIMAGQLDEAREFLGHPHVITGQVVHGKQLGRTLGIPTANVIIPDGVLTPPFGVYAAMVQMQDGRRFMAVVNIGVRPTVDKDSDRVTVEPYILDFTGDLYGSRLRVELYSFLRRERKFPDLDSLKAEIRRNERQTREYFA